MDLEDMYNQPYTWLESGSVYLLNHLNPLFSVKSIIFNTVAEHAASEPYLEKITLEEFKSSHFLSKP